MKKRFLARLLAATAAIAATTSPPAGAADCALDAGQSVLAVLTHKGGIASGLAHDHLITAPVGALALTFDPSAPEASRATLRLAVEKLEIDHHAARAKWKGRLHELGAGPETLDPIAEADRAEVREAMLGAGQLDAAKFPEISAELVALTRRATASGAFDWDAKLRVTVHGKTIERAIPATFKVEGGKVTAEALGEYRFTEFGIKPYSAALGAVKNQDRFHLYLMIVAAPKE